MLNNVTLTGRMTRNPELKQFPSGEVLPFTLACTRDYKDKKTGEYATDFMDCVTWKHNATYLGKYALKGDMVQVSGRLEIDDWTDKEGKKRRSVKINANHVYIVSRKGKDQEGNATGHSGNTGNSGNIGNTGNTGNSGNFGNTGSYGNTGNTGSYGNTGNTGSYGNHGNSGGYGNHGNTGGYGT